MQKGSIKPNSGIQELNGFCKINLKRSFNPLIPQFALSKKIIHSAASAEL